MANDIATSCINTAMSQKCYKMPSKKRKNIHFSIYYYKLELKKKFFSSNFVAFHFYAWAERKKKKKTAPKIR